MNVPFLDLQLAYGELQEQIDEALRRVASSGVYVLGDEVSAFEAEWADYCNARYAVGVGSGLDALVLSLKALGVGPGDEVIVPSHTFIATWLAVSHCGCTPVPVEPTAEGFNIDIAAIEAAITPATKGFIPVHLYGEPADLDPILALSRELDLFVLEDAAQAHGAMYKGRRIGSIGNATAWSFYPGKNLGAMGDGGAITTNDESLANRLRLLRNYGSERKYFYEIAGFNSRLDPLQAAVLRVKLRHLDDWNVRRRRIAQAYCEGLRDVAIKLPDVPEWAEHVWHLFVVRTAERDRLRSTLEASGIGTGIHYPVPPHKQSAYAHNKPLRSPLPVASSMASDVLSLPIGPHLSEEQIKQVCEVLVKASQY
jgi:dTDP-4-amino-4,6-dideoxygalactose transaminase